MRSTRCVRYGAVLVTIALASLTALAQVIAPGSHVRIYPLAGTQPSEGSLLAMTSDSLSLHIGSSSIVQTLPMDSVRAIDVGQGTRARHVVLRDAALGAAIGIGVVFLADRAVCADRHDQSSTCDINAYLFGIPVGIGGALIGAHIGKNGRKEQWKRVFDRERVAKVLVGPTAHHGFAVGLSIPFGGSGSAAEQP